MSDLPDPGLQGLQAAAGRFAETAAPEAEVVFAEIASPVGPLLAAATPVGLARLAYREANGGRDAVLDDLARRIGPRIVEAPGRLDAIRRELEEFFDGRRTSFDLALDLRLVTPFARRVLAAAAAIEFGATATYAQVAAAAGSPSSSRAAGNALGANPVPIVVPCHRVLRSGGGLGGYTGGLAIKRVLLTVEGVTLA